MKRVRFTKSFLQSTGQYTGPDAPTSYGPFAKGKVIHTKVMPTSLTILVTVEWEDGEVTRVNEANLEACR